MPRSGSPRLESYCEPSYRLTIRMKIGVLEADSLRLCLC
jgi:hypothetical protein